MAVPKKLLAQEKEIDKTFEQDPTKTVSDVPEGQVVDVDDQQNIQSDQLSTDEGTPKKEDEPGKTVEDFPVDYKHKASVLEGMLESAGTDLKRERARSEALMEILKDQGARGTDQEIITTGIQTPQADQQVIKPEQIDEEEFSQYGPEIVKMVRFTNRLLKETAELQNTNQRLLANDEKIQANLQDLGTGFENVKANVHQTAEGAYTSSLYRAHKDFDAVNSHPEWYKFLDQPDGYSGMTRRQIAEFANSKLNADPIIQMVTDFKKEYFANHPPGSGDQPQPSGQETSQSNLSGQIVPDEGLSASDVSANLPKDFKVVTREQYKEAGRKLFSNKISQEDFDKIELAFYKSVDAGKA